MVSQTGRYALRILGYLADHRGQWIQGSQISSDTGIPSNYLSKILNQLRKRRFVLSRKGWGGGFLLNEDARTTPILEVLDLFQGARDDKQCIFGLRKCDAENPCPLHEPWAKIQDAYQHMLSRTTISDLRTISIP